MGTTCSNTCSDDCRACLDLTSAEVKQLKQLFTTHLLPEIETALKGVVQEELKTLEPQLRQAIQQILLEAIKQV